MSQIEILHRLGIEKSSSTGVLDAREAAGLIQRERSIEDRRRFVVRPTKKALLVRDDVLPHARKAAERACHGIDENELSMFFRVLDQTIENLEQNHRYETFTAFATELQASSLAIPVEQVVES